ncbi:beta-D-xylosidase 2 isoform X2, partial [Biomphalaria pfeifferi]
DAVNQGKLTEEIVRESVKPLFYTRMRLGGFDPTTLLPNWTAVLLNLLNTKRWPWRMP